MIKMKNHLILSLLILSVGLSQQEYRYNDLIVMDNGLYTIKFSDEPITGKVYGYFGEEGNLEKVYIGNLLNGKKEGKWTWWYHETGRKSEEINYKKGEIDGLHIEWYENGNKESEGTVKDGKWDGLLTKWYEDGQKFFEISFKVGIEDGLSTEWYVNGQKRFQRTKKNGKDDGLYIEWYKNGNKKSEMETLNGTRIYYWLYDKNGNITNSY